MALRFRFKWSVFLYVGIGAIVISCGDDKPEKKIEQRLFSYDERVKADSVLTHVFERELDRLVSFYKADTIAHAPMFGFEFQDYLDSISSPILIEGDLVDVVRRDSLYYLEISEVGNFDYRWANFKLFELYRKGHFHYPERYVFAEIALDSMQFLSVRDSLKSKTFSGRVGVVFNMTDAIWTDHMYTGSSCDDEGKERPALRENVKRVLLKGRLIDYAILSRS
jgi:hypothetical protein